MPPALAGFLDVNIKWTEESDIELSLRKKKKKREEKNKEHNKNVFTISCSCVSNRHDEHCAF